MKDLGNEKWKNDCASFKIDPLKEYAAVAIVISNGKFVLEKRSENIKDLWSGQFSLPGGHKSSEDENLMDTALRETMEETGINLRVQSKYLFSLGPFSPRNKQNLEVCAFAFETYELFHLVGSSESDFLLWVDFSDLKPEDGELGRQYRINEGYIWGLTARILDKFFEVYRIDKK